jgi:hypothetical protein
MGTKKKGPAKTKNTSSNKLEANQRTDDSKTERVARVALQPTVQAALTLKEYGKDNGELDLIGLISALSEQTNATNDGDLKRTEVMLAAQAHTLDAIFNALARRAINSDHIDKLDRYLKLALRAQSQCRATIDTLATTKNPPSVSYVQQANIAHGPQQVNNGVAVVTEPRRTQESENLQNKLLEAKHGERLDTRTTGATSRDDSAMATMGEVNRANDDRR